MLLRVKRCVCFVFVGVDRHDCMSSPEGMDEEVDRESGSEGGESGE